MPRGTVSGRINVGRTSSEDKRVKRRSQLCQVACRKIERHFYGLATCPAHRIVVDIVSVPFIRKLFI
jgi:hypothetical protein